MFPGKIGKLKTSLGYSVCSIGFGKNLDETSDGCWRRDYGHLNSETPSQPLRLCFRGYLGEDNT